MKCIIIAPGLAPLGHAGGGKLTGGTAVLSGGRKRIASAHLTTTSALSTSSSRHTQTRERSDVDLHLRRGPRGGGAA